MENLIFIPTTSKKKYFYRRKDGHILFNCTLYIKKVNKMFLTIIIKIIFSIGFNVAPIVIDRFSYYYRMFLGTNT